MAKFKIQKSATVNVGFDSTAAIGGTGGLTSISGNQIQVKVYLNGGSANSNGSILRQKGKGRFLVTDGTRTGVCTFVNKAGGSLAVGEMSLTATTSAPATFYVYRITNKFLLDFDGNKYQWKFGAATSSAVSIPGA
jgi:hypothetical protein